MADDADQWLGLLLSPSGPSVGQPDDPELRLKVLILNLHAEIRGILGYRDTLRCRPQNVPHVCLSHRDAC